MAVATIRDFSSFHIARKGLLLALCVVVCIVGLLGCLRPLGLTERLQRLAVEQMHPDLGHLRLVMTYCEGTEQVSDAFSLSRDVSLPVGQEVFYMFSPLQGKVDLKVYAYRSRNDKELLQHARLQFFASADTMTLPTIQLVDGKPDQEVYWCEPLPVPAPPVTTPPAKREIVWSDTVNVSGKPSSSHLPPLWSPDDLPVPPAKTPPTSPAEQNQDLLLWRQPLSWKGSPIDLVAHGRQVVVLNRTEQGIAHLSIINVLYTSANERRIALPDKCAPSSIDVASSVVAVACTGLNRIFFYSLNSDSLLAPKAGYEVGPKPIAVRMSGHVVVVLHKGLQRIAVFRRDQLELAYKTIDVGEEPVALTSVGDWFFIANASSDSVTPLRFDHELQQTSNETPYQVGSRPISIDANQFYFVTANEKSQNISIRYRLKDITRTLYIGGIPSSVRIINHTALVGDPSRNRLYVVDLQRGEVSQTLDMKVPVDRLTITGEWVLMTTTEGSLLPRASFQTRSHQVQLRVGALPGSIHIVGSQAFLHDPFARRLMTIDLREPKVTSSIPIDMDPAWMTGTNDYLIHAKRDKQTLVVRGLGSITRSDVVHRYDTPIFTGRVAKVQTADGKTLERLYLLHWDPAKVGDSRTVKLSVVDVLSPDGSRTWDFINTVQLRLADGKANRPVDVLPWGDKHVVIADQRKSTLFLVRLGESLRGQPPQPTTLQAIELDGHEPRRMVSVGGYLAVLLDNNDIWLLEVNASTSTFHRIRRIKPLVDSGELRDMRALGGLLAVTDARNGLVYFIEPLQQTVQATIPVGCEPSLTALWTNPSDPIWRSMLVVPNTGDDSLSFVPLQFGPFKPGNMSAP